MKWSCIEKSYPFRNYTRLETILCARYGLESNEIDNQPSTPDAYQGIYVY